MDDRTRYTACYVLLVAVHPDRGWIDLSNACDATTHPSGATMIDLYEQQIAETRRTNAGLERIAAALELGIGRTQPQVD